MGVVSDVFELDDEFGTDATPPLDVGIGGSGETDAGRSQAARVNRMKEVNKAMKIKDNDLCMDRSYGCMGVWRMVACGWCVVK